MADVKEDNGEDELTQQMDDMSLNDERQSEADRLRQMRSMLAFDKKPDYVEEIMQAIPTGNTYK